MPLNKVRLEMVRGSISEDDVVCDVGGGQKPFNRADYIIDIQGFDEGFKAGSYGDNVRVDKSRWVKLDINRDRFPFKDNFFDFVFCTHTLEDIYNPFHAIDEISRVGRRGYIETPSARWELSKGVSYRGIIGAPHHKWIIYKEKDRIVFVEKNQLISKRKHHMKKRGLTEENSYMVFFWDETIEYEIKCFVHDIDFKRFVRGLIDKVRT